MVAPPAVTVTINGIVVAAARRRDRRDRLGEHVDEADTAPLEAVDR